MGRVPIPSTASAFHAVDFLAWAFRRLTFRIDLIPAFSPKVKRLSHDSR
jgi:hypothetical protein